jgi:signal peptidase I
VIGLPGDVVTMNNKIIQMNGQTLSYKPLAKSPDVSNHTTTSAIETVGDIKHYINIDNTASGNLSNFVPVTGSLFSIG